MTVTAQLVSLFRCDQQLRGLQTRLTAADRFLAEQERQLKDASTKLAGLEGDLKKVKVAVNGQEGEAEAIEARMAQLREQMNAAKTNKEYSAFLSELDTLKKRKKEIEDGALEQMGKVEGIEKTHAEAKSKRDERQGIVEQAKRDRATKEAEIRDRVGELKAQRATLTQGIPPEILRVFEELVGRLGDEAMAPVQVLDRRNHEWTCGACQVVVPVQVLNDISAGKFTRCKSCTCILYTEEDVTSKKPPKMDKDTVESTKKAAKKKAKDTSASM